MKTENDTKKEGKSIEKVFLSKLKEIAALLKGATKPESTTNEVAEEEVVNTELATVETEASVTATSEEEVVETNSEDTIDVNAAATEPDLTNEETAAVDAELSTTEVEEGTGTVETELALENFSIQELADLLDLKMNGVYTIEFSVKGGRVLWGEIYASTYTQLLEKETNSDKETIAKLENTIKETETKLDVLLNETGTDEFVEIVEKPKSKPLTQSERRVEMKKEELRDKRKNA